MLGIPSKKGTIKGKYAKELLEKIKRYSTGNLTEEEKEAERRLEESRKKWKVEWE